MVKLDPAAMPQFAAYEDTPGSEPSDTPPAPRKLRLILEQVTFPKNPESGKIRTELDNTSIYSYCIVVG